MIIWWTAFKRRGKFNDGLYYHQCIVIVIQTWVLISSHHTPDICYNTIIICTFCCSFIIIITIIILSSLLLTWGSDCSCLQSNRKTKCLKVNHLHWETCSSRGVLVSGEIHMKSQTFSCITLCAPIAFTFFIIFFFVIFYI